MMSARLRPRRHHGLVQGSRASRVALAAVLGSVALGAIGCAGNGERADGAGPASAAALPEGVPGPAEAIAPLAFLQGSWIAVNPNKTVNREQWTAPRGRTMTGAFHQLRRDGTPSFYELTTIVAEDTGVTLYHRHLHRKLEIDERRASTDVFRLVRTETNTAVFEPVEGTGAAGEQGIASMTYRLDDQGRLTQELRFKPGSKEKDFTSVYVRE